VTRELLSTIDVSEILGVCIRDVFTMIENGELDGQRVGRTVMVRQSALDAYLAKHRDRDGRVPTA
jgi:excisionase family DNA binding protein